MATITWPWVAGRMRHTSAVQDESVRRVGVRLAAQTVGLLLVMLLALEVVVYVITQQAILGSLESQLRERATPMPGFLCQVYHLPCGQQGAYGGDHPTGGPPGGNHPQGGSGPGSSGGGPPPGGPQGGPGYGPGGPGGPSPFNPDTNPSDVSSVFVDRNLQIVHHDGALGNVLLDKQGIRQALSTRQPLDCGVHSYQGQDYLVYTAPVRVSGKIIGAVQNSISERQYETAMNTILLALLVVALLGLVTSGGISLVLVRRALQPIRSAIQHQRDFVADAAHELRTPLAIQRTVGEVGMADQSADELQATIAQMLGENQHLTRLVEDLSLLARTDTNAVAIERHPVDLSTLVTETAAEIQPLAEAQEVTLEAEVDEDVNMLGDLLRLRQLLLILLDNALKHTPAGGTVGVALALQGTRVRLQIADTGPGIDPAHLPRIFDRFYRADQARTEGGSGLGLAIAKWIVEAHAGHIQAGNSTPHGAVFTVLLPVARAKVVS